MRLEMQKSGLQAYPHLFRYAAMPLLISIYPAVFHYANNAQLVPLASFLELCLFLAGIGLVIYSLLALFSKGNFLPADVGALLILVFFSYLWFCIRQAPPY